jgi:hypothetical protein
LDQTPIDDDRKELRISPEMASTKLLVLRFIRNYIGKWKQSPSQGEIVNGCKLTRTSVRNALRSLQRDGLILRTPGPRGIALPAQRDAALRTLEALGYQINADLHLPLLPPPVLDYPIPATSEIILVNGTKAANKALSEHRRKVGSDFAIRHPARAADERALKQANRAAARDYGHKVHGTVETHAKAARIRQGSLALMFEKGQITINQLAASQQIRVVVERIGLDVKIGSVSLEARVDESRSGSGSFFESLGAVRAEVAYNAWRKALGDRVGIVLLMIVDDIAFSSAARLHRMGPPRARRILIDALDAWSKYMGDACNKVDEATLLAAQAGVL